ncbi:MAG: hypothetical protein HPAVJP_5570 [Candidatus Hepatoplasma vulgare]|nr:MAG: hypothetical protein HPAVJP_5570 [Candidatus Hepatoplasma sp.]
MKNFILFFIFLGLGTFFIYLTILTKNQIDHWEHTDFEIKLLKILFLTWIFFDLGFYIASIWNLYKSICKFLKKILYFIKN